MLVGAWLLVGSLALLTWVALSSLWALVVRSRTPADEAAAEARRVADALRRAENDHAKAVKRVERDQTKIVKGATKDLERARRDHEKAVRRAEKDLEAARSPGPLAQTFLPTVRLYEDRIQTPDGTRMLTPQLEAAVDTAGNFVVGGRSTLTRMGAHLPRQPPPRTGARRFRRESAD